MPATPSPQIRADRLGDRRRRGRLPGAGLVAVEPFRSASAPSGTSATPCGGRCSPVLRLRLPQVRPLRKRPRRRSRRPPTPSPDPGRSAAGATWGRGNPTTPIPVMREYNAYLARLAKADAARHQARPITRTGPPMGAPDTPEAPVQPTVPVEDPHRPQRLPGAGVDDGHLAHRAVLRDGDESTSSGGQPADLDRCGARLGCTSSTCCSPRTWR